MPEKAGAARKGRAGLGDMEDVFAGKDETVVALAEPAARQGRGGAAPGPATPAASPAQPEEEPPLITTVRIPGYLAENIRRWLYENPRHTQHSMIFAGLARLGIDVRAEDLEPRRRPRSSRHR
jgi:hypothetical protein